MKIYDFENHFYAKELIEHLQTRSEFPFADEKRNIHISDQMVTIADYEGINTPGHTMTDDLIEISSGRIKDMDKSGLGVACLSTSDCIELLPREEAIRMSQITNNAAAQAVKEHPDRFVGSFCLPTPYVEDSLIEMERAVKELGLKYWHTHSCYGKIRLYEEKFEPIFAKLNELGCAFAVHPTYTEEEYLLDMGLGLATSAYGFAADVMKTTAMLIYGGLFDRYPNLKMIVGHMGEFYPYIIDRMDHMMWDVFRTLDPTVKAKKHITEYFTGGNIFLSTSGIFSTDVAMFAINKFGIDAFVYGSDYPYENMSKSMDFINNLPLNAEDKDKIFYKNAEKYLI